MSITKFQLEGLERLGYSTRESEFLFLVATHSGYFTNRQFKDFARTESGSVSHAFIRKLLDRKHASYQAYRSGGRVYHLFARKLYQAMERENFRTRKKHELDYVKTRLVTLDFILKHPQYRYFESEAEKVSFFENEWRVQRTSFPVKQYRARKSAEITPRYFVDRFPIFLTDEGAPAVATFTYVDAEAITLDGFGTHLRAYSGLFQALPSVELIYVAPTARLFPTAESAFRKALYGRPLPKDSTGLLAYFRIRKAWDAKERVSSRDVVLLKEAQQRYVSQPFEGLYQKWACSDLADADVSSIVKQDCRAPKSIFRTLLCGSSLSVFADPRANSSENSAEKNSASEPHRISDMRSVQISGT